MAFGLGALAFAVRAEARISDSVLCGLLSAATLLTYNGYFLLAAAALVIHALWASSWPDAMRRVAGSVVAFALPFAAIAAAEAIGGGDFFRGWVAFSSTVTQGSFAEGWRLPFAYLWNAEHFLTALWA